MYVHAPNSGDYQDLIKYLKHSKVYFALTIDPVIYELYIRQFWSSAELTKVDGVSMINTTVNDQEILISEGTIHTHLRRMGYEGEFNHTTIRKCMLSCNWRYVCHLVLHCLSSRKSRWDDLSLHLSSTVVLTAHIPYGNSNLPELEETLDLVHLNPKVVMNMKKNHSRGKFSGIETPIFQEMMGFEDIESEAESSSSGSSSDNVEDDNVDGQDGEGENVNANVKFNHEELHTTQDTPRVSPDHERISSPIHSTSSEGDAERQGEKVFDEEVFDGKNSGNASPSSPNVADADVAGPSSPIGEQILSYHGSPIKNIDKRKQIVIEDDPPKVTSKPPKADVDIANAAAESLSSILSKKLEEEKKSASERMNIPRKYARVYLRKKVTQDVQSKPPLFNIPEVSPKVQKSNEDVSKEEKATPMVVQEPVKPSKQVKNLDIKYHKNLDSLKNPRKNSIPRRVVKKGMNVRIPSKDKYKILYDSEHVDDLTDRDLDIIIYFFEHGLKWGEIFAMSINKLEDTVQEIKSKMTKEELERDSQIFFLKANNHKSKHLKNMRTETLKKLVNDIKNFDTQKSLFEAILRELDATKLNPNVNVDEVSKEIYSSYAAEAPIKVSAESKATWFKKKLESSLRVKHPKVPQRRMSRFRNNVHDVVTRKTVRKKAPTVILPQYNEDYSKNSESLQPFTRDYVDDMAELVAESGDNMEPLRMYDLAHIRTLTNEDIFALAAMEIAYNHEDVFYARDFENLLTKVSMDMRAISYDFISHMGRSNVLVRASSNEMGLKGWTVKIH
ncbi:hypothetical protein L1987_56765 [Smallanthus sonchifolius]|uniref:Uncharacterized protein n=1 Tax=Smallanthus sonchifolius TaxID=185202 RepID=A0ACB9DB32_9ASTR|nr:hypothetical protein L1987_56765 [Smallanthus sonchifolius]